LTPLAIAMGLADEARKEGFEKRRGGVDELSSLLEGRKISQVDGRLEAALLPHLGESLSTALKDPRIGALVDEASDIREFLVPFIPEASAYPDSWILTAILDARYKGYLEKEDRLASRVDRSDRLRIPADFDYASVAGLSKEGMEKLLAVKPLTLGQASRVPGVRKSDAALLYVVLARASAQDKG
jgi:tRNA uridine 5-carboxymethylaminomethyl modification enzyme